MLRPRPARWFEILAARDDATLVLEALARTGEVELEARTHTGLPDELTELTPLLARFQGLAARYHADWPAATQCRPSAFPEAPQAALRRSLTVIEAWAHEAEPDIRAQQHLQAERAELALWALVLTELATRAIDPSAFTTAGPWLRVMLLLLPVGVDAGELAPASASPTGTVAPSLSVPLALDRGTGLLVIAEPAAAQALAQAVTTLKGSAHAPPTWLQADAAANQRYLQERGAAIESELARLQAGMQARAERHGLPCALGDANRLQWLLQNVRELEAGELLCWITGWCSDAANARLAQALQDSGARALLRFAPSPVGAKPPLLLDNPAWAKPFEIFSRALGMPGADEADPSPLLAVAVPLMFGYMFGDVGQGLVLAAAGWWWRKQFAVARLLMVGGLSAAVFGLLFGSVFSLHGVLPALWLHPLDAPLPVLVAPLFGGAVLLTLGLGLGALSAGWAGEWRRWWLTDAALVLVYGALLAAFVWPVALLVAAAGALYFCAGHAWLERRWGAGLAALGELVEKTLQIMINTLSFARVGAFALAHAGLSSAIVALVDAADGWVLRALVLVLGNAIVIVLEVMVVAIQTTRLVLFEFFTRFMQGQGRTFRALPPPPFTLQEP